MGRPAARGHVVLLAPDGITASDGKSAWNDCRSDAATNATTDDVGLIAALIDVAADRFDADPARMFVFGVSNGGVMAYRAGIELAPRLAAIGVQDGARAAHSRSPAPRYPLSVYIEHGTADPVIPYAGGHIGSWFLRQSGTSLGTDEAAALWRKLDCIATPPTRCASHTCTSTTGRRPPERCGARNRPGCRSSCCGSRAAATSKPARTDTCPGSPTGWSAT